VNDRNDPRSLSNNVIRTIYEDHSGTIWIGTDGGLNKIVSTSQGEKFISYRNEPGNRKSLKPGPEWGAVDLRRPQWCFVGWDLERRA
jgi:hypothetical protein